MSHRNDSTIPPREDTSSQKPIRVLHVLGQLSRGGAEMRTIELMQHIDRERYEFDFCCLSGLPGELDNEVRLLGGTVHLIPLGVSFPGAFRKLLRSRNYQTIHSHVHWPSGYILRLAAQAGVPQRICEFASTSDGKQQTFVRRMRNRLLRHWMEKYSTEILGVSEGALSANWGPRWRDDRRCRVIYRGIESSALRGHSDGIRIRADLGIPQDAVVVIHVGRMDPSKNHQRVLAIFERFLSLVPNAYLLLVGDKRDPIQSSLQRTVEQHGIAARVLLTGVRSDVLRLLRTADLMIFPSLWEGLPGAVLEAVAAGVPVLASDLPGIDEIACHLPGVRTMSLDRPDEEWAATALGYRSCRDESDLTEHALRKSPFAMEHAVKSYERLYQGGSLAQATTAR